MKSEEITENTQNQKRKNLQNS